LSSSELIKSDHIQKDKKAYLLITIGVFAIEFLYGTVCTIWGVILPPLMKQYNITVTDIGAAGSRFGLGAIVAVLILMYILDRFKKPKVLCLIAAIFFVAIFMQGLAPAFYVLPIAYFLEGLAGMAIDTIHSAIIIDIYGEKSRFYINILHGMFGIGCILGPIYAQLLLSSGLKWNSAYFFISVAIAVVCLVYTILVFTHKGSIDRLKVKNVKASEKQLSVKQFLSRKEVIITILAIFVIKGSYIMAGNWFVKYMQDSLSATAVLSTAALTLFYAGLTLSRFTAPLFYKKIEPLRTLIMLLGLGGIVLIICVLLNNAYAMLLGTLFAGYGFGTAVPVLVANLCSLFPGQSGRASSFVFIGMSISSISFSVISAAIIAAFGLSAGVIAAGLFLIIPIPFVIALVYLNNKNKRDPEAIGCENAQTNTSVIL